LSDTVFAMSHGETFLVVKGSVPGEEEKHRLYRQARQSLIAMLEGESDAILLMSSIVAVLHQSMPHYFWTGFYRVVGQELLVGPYQGTPACLRIRHGYGVCGTAWAEGVTQLVADVHAFPGHIACDVRSQSEIVVPWRDRAGEIIAVLDVDSDQKNAFDAIDREWLETLATAFPPV
jgi:L-methionine (R)-S-oxide reductase